MAARFIAWLDERVGIISIWDTIFDRKIPKVNWWFTLGSASLFLFVMQGLTGIFLSVYYVPTPDHAYDSIQYIMNGVAFGWLIRGMHHWGATLMVIVVFAHMLRTFYYASYKFPRELTWLSGVLLLLATLGMGFSGYLLPMNQRSYWATTVGTEIAGSIPVIGQLAFIFLRAGWNITSLTLSRFFGLHVLVLPLITVGTMLMHFLMVRKQGIMKPL